MCPLKRRSWRASGTTTGGTRSRVGVRLAARRLPPKALRFPGPRHPVRTRPLRPLPPRRRDGRRQDRPGALHRLPLQERVAPPHSNSFFPQDTWQDEIANWLPEFLESKMFRLSKVLKDEIDSTK